MILVGSLAFFIEAAVYHGPHDLRLKWLIFWCVLAMVGVSRIAIEKTPAYAGVYALILGFAAYTFVRSVLRDAGGGLVDSHHHLVVYQQTCLRLHVD